MEIEPEENLYEDVDTPTLFERPVGNEDSRILLIYWYKNNKRVILNKLRKFWTQQYVDVDNSALTLSIDNDDNYDLDGKDINDTREDRFTNGIPDEIVYFSSEKEVKEWCKTISQKLADQEGVMLSFNLYRMAKNRPGMYHKLDSAPSNKRKRGILWFCFGCSHAPLDRKKVYGEDFRNGKDACNGYNKRKPHRRVE